MKIKEYFISSTDNKPLFIRHFQPDSPSKVILVILHGFSEHSGRYIHWAKRFVREGYEVYSMDYRGHGKAGGIRGHTPSYNYLLDDTQTCLNQIKNQRNLPVILYGQSLGGNIVLNYGILKGHHLAGIISTSPWLRLVTKPKTITILMARILRLLAPKLIKDSKLDVNLLSHDPKVVIDYENDPLTHSFITPQLFFGAEKAAKRVMKKLDEINVPILLMHGTGDLVTSWKASKKFAENAKNFKKNITFRLWKGYYHELHNEINKDEVFIEIIKWIENKILNSKSK